MQGQIALLQGGQQIGDFVIEAEQGRGGMAVVYRAQQVSLKRTVALKLMLPQISVDPQAVVRFQQEAQHAARLSHPHIVTIYSIGELTLPNGLTVPYIAMQYISGTTLRELIQNEPLSPQQAVTILTQVASALDYAHSYGMIHRDIKPSNILLSTTGVAYLTDFGLATAIGSGSGLTRSGVVIGTPEYMAPEQAEGRGNIGTTADVYALGLVLFEMLTGTLPFEADTPMGVMLARLMHPPRALHDLRPDLPPMFGAVIETALARDPAQRYPTAGALVAALHALEPTAAAVSSDAPTIPVAAVASNSPPLVATPVVGPTVSLPDEHGPLVATPDTSPPPAPTQSAVPIAQAPTQAPAHSPRPSNALLGYGLIGLGVVALLLALLMRINPPIVRLTIPLLLLTGTLLSVFVIVQSLRQRGRVGGEQHVQRTRLLGMIGVGLLLLGGLSAARMSAWIERNERYESAAAVVSPAVIADVLPIPQIPPDAQSNELLTQARTALAAGDYATAQALIAQVLEREPQSVPAYTLAGHAYLLQAASTSDKPQRTAAAQQAIAAYTQARGLLEHSNAELEAGLGWAYRYLGNFREAQLYFERALDFDDEHVQALSGLAWTLYDSAEYRRSVELFEKALDELDDADPAIGQLYLGLGRALEQMQDYDDAIDAYEHALQHDPQLDYLTQEIERLERFR